MRKQKNSTKKTLSEVDRTENLSTRPLLFFSQIEGQDHVIQRIKAALKRNRLHHSYVLSGPKGTGKKTCLRSLYAQIQCQTIKGTLDANFCGICDSCYKIQKGVHPDYWYIQLSLTGLADQIQTLLERLRISPNEGSLRFVIFDSAELLSFPSAQIAANRLLKTLEEPPLGNHFFFLLENAKNMLTTLLSRSQILQFSPLSEDQMEKILLQSYEGDLSDSVVKQIIFQAQGSPGYALEEFKNTEKKQKYSMIAEQFIASKRLSRSIFQELSALSKEEITDFLDLLWKNCYFQMRHKEKLGEELKEIELTQSICKIRAVEEALQDLRRNISSQALLEKLFDNLQ